MEKYGKPEAGYIRLLHHPRRDLAYLLRPPSTVHAKGRLHPSVTGYVIDAEATPTFCDLHPQPMPAHVEAQVRDDGIDPLHPELGDHVIEAASGSGRGKDG